MTNKVKHNLLSISIYTIVVFILLLPCKLGWSVISISIILGLFLGILNDILLQLRKLNGEKFEKIENKPIKRKDELIKS